VFLKIPAGLSPTPIIENVSAITSFFLALILFPRVQIRAQTELDVVIGRDRLPTVDDRPRLPYIEALCKELLRWKMATPVGMTWGFYESSKVELQNDVSQVLPIRQVKIVFIGASSFRKVSYSFDSPLLAPYYQLFGLKGATIIADAWYVGCLSVRMLI
jgi:hypothetical protein